MNYFISQIQECTYSPNWYGTLDWAPPATVLLYNDNELFCIGHMEGDLPPGVEGITEEQANEYLAAAAVAGDIDGVWFGEKLTRRWDEEVTSEEDTVEDAEDLPAQPEKVMAGRQIKFCPVCHKEVCRVIKYDDGSVDISQGGKAVVGGIKATTLSFTCPNGHNVKLTIV